MIIFILVVLHCHDTDFERKNCEKERGDHLVRSLTYTQKFTFQSLLIRRIDLVCTKQVQADFFTL